MENSGKYVNEQNWQRLRKVFLIVAIIGIGLLIGGLILLISGISIDVPAMGEDGWFDETSRRNGMMFGGGVMMMFGLVMTIGGITAYFKRQLAGAAIQGAMPVAGEAINQGVHMVTPAIQQVTQTVATSVKQAGKKDIEAELARIDDLRKRGVITEEEYTRMRNNILGIN